MNKSLIKVIIGVIAVVSLVLLSTSSDIKGVFIEKNSFKAGSLQLEALPGIHTVNTISPYRWEPGKTLKGEVKGFLDNKGAIDSVVSVQISAYFTDSNGNKMTINPEDYVDIHYVNVDDNGYFEDFDAATVERKVFYYSKLAGPLENLPVIIDSVYFKEDVDIDAVCNPTFENGEYNGNCKTDDLIFNLYVYYGNVQAKYGLQAAKSAWGVDLCQVTNNMHELC